MPEYFKAKCPNCGSQRIVGWYGYDEQGLQYHVECTKCGYRDETVNIKCVEAFPEWFEIIEEAE